MNKRLILAVLVLALIPLLAACGGGDKVTADQVENALQKSLEGDNNPLKEITCDAEHASLDEASLGALFSNPDGTPMETDLKFECSEEGDNIQCTMSGSVAGQEIPAEQGALPAFKVVDGKLCGQG
jgi:hypothetical protein